MDEEQHDASPSPMDWSQQALNEAVKASHCPFTLICLSLCVSTEAH